MRARISPLWQLPAPTLGAHFSRLAWAFPREFRGTITLDLPRLHDQLGTRSFLPKLSRDVSPSHYDQGPLIRIAPNEVSFYSREIYDTVHKVGSKFKKDPRTYGEFVQGGHPALFSITFVITLTESKLPFTQADLSGNNFSDPAEHSRRRRIMGALFSRSKVPQLEALMAGHVQRFLTSVRPCGPLIIVSRAFRDLEADIVCKSQPNELLNIQTMFSHPYQIQLISHLELLFKQSTRGLPALNWLLYQRMTKRLPGCPL